MERVAIDSSTGIRTDSNGVTKSGAGVAAPFSPLRNLQCAHCVVELVGLERPAPHIRALHFGSLAKRHSFDAASVRRFSRRLNFQPSFALEVGSPDDWPPFLD